MYMPYMLQVEDILINMSAMSEASTSMSELNVDALLPEDLLEEDEELKEVNDDLELLELKDDDSFKGIVFHLKSQNPELPVSSPPSCASKNRRYTLRPQKKSETTDCNKFKSSSSNKKAKPNNGSLETIFENPVLRNGAVTLLGKKQMKRYLSFDSFVSKTKLRHRKLKLKRLGKGKKKNSLKVSIEDVKLKLKALEDVEDEWMDEQ